MGNKIPTRISMSNITQKNEKFESVESFRFHEPFSEDSTNGLCFNEIYLPEEIVMMILSHVDPREILKASLVCRKWCNIIKSNALWSLVYYRQYKKKPKKLPWYVYYCLFSTNHFDTNRIKNGNGEEKYKHWKIMKNYGDEFRIENPPCSADPLPLGVPEFHGHTSCFATSYYECNKLQEISFENSRLMQLIFNQYRPHIYLSEWVAARFDCGCSYKLWCKLCSKNTSNSKEARSRWEDGTDNESYSSDESTMNVLHIQQTETSFAQWAGSPWQKVELLVKDYPSGVQTIIFQHEGRDTQFWKGHYGSKMAGGVLKILFHSIEEP